MPAQPGRTNKGKLNTAYLLYALERLDPTNKNNWREAAKQRDKPFSKVNKIYNKIRRDQGEPENDPWNPEPFDLLGEEEDPSSAKADKGSPDVFYDAVEPPAEPDETLSAGEALVKGIAAQRRLYRTESETPSPSTRQIKARDARAAKRDAAKEKLFQAHHAIKSDMERKGAVGVEGVIGNLTRSAEKVKKDGQDPDAVDEILKNEFKNMRESADEPEDVEDLAFITAAQQKLPQGAPSDMSRAAEGLRGSSVLNDQQKEFVTPGKSFSAPALGTSKSEPRGELTPKTLTYPDPKTVLTLSSKERKKQKWIQNPLLQTDEASPPQQSPQVDDIVREVRQKLRDKGSPPASPRTIPQTVSGVEQDFEEAGLDAPDPSLQGSVRTVPHTDNAHLTSQVNADFLAQQQRNMEAIQKEIAKQGDRQKVLRGNQTAAITAAVMQVNDNLKGTRKLLDDNPEVAQREADTILRLEERYPKTAKLFERGLISTDQMEDSEFVDAMEKSLNLREEREGNIKTGPMRQTQTQMYARTVPRPGGVYKYRRPHFSTSPMFETTGAGFLKNLKATVRDGPDMSRGFHL